MTESCKTHTLDFFVLRKAKFQLICMEPSQNGIFTCGTKNLRPNRGVSHYRFLPVSRDFEEAF